MKKKVIKAKLDKTKKKLVKVKSKLTKTLSELESVKKPARKPAAAVVPTKKSAAPVRKPIRKKSPLKKPTTRITPSVPTITEPVVSEVERVSEPSPELAATNGQG